MSDEEYSIYDEVEIEDMTYDPALQTYSYPCPCGDKFEIALADLQDGQDIAVCPSCSLMVRVIFELVSIALFSWPGTGWKDGGGQKGFARTESQRMQVLRVRWLTDALIG